MNNTATMCAACHGVSLAGGQGPSLLGVLKHGDDMASIARSIATGYPETGMPSFGSALSATDIQNIAAYIGIMRDSEAARQRQQSQPQPVPAGIVHSPSARFTVERVAQAGPAFGLAFLPDGRILVTETGGVLRVVNRDGKLGTITGTPPTSLPPEYFHRQMMGISLHPDYARNGWIYLLLTSPEQPPAGTGETAIELHRGRISNNRWKDDEKLFTYRSPFTSGAVMAWDKTGHIFMGADFSDASREGDLAKTAAQDVTSFFGKVLRVTAEGRAPPDNPFADKAGAGPYVWSYGHRALTGLAVDSRGELWEAEHGPRGGDEINHIRPGRNYGWPVITWGHVYDDRLEPAKPEAIGMEQPVVSFVPSPAPGGLAIYEGSGFPQWRGDLLMGTLKGSSLYRLRVQGAKEVLREVVLSDIGRIRQVAQGLDGMPYLLLDSGSLLRLRPADKQ